MSFYKLFFFLMMLCLPVIAAAQTGTIRGTVVSEINGARLHGVSVQITQLRRQVETDAEGVYEFTGLASGTYTVLTHQEGFSDRAQTVTVGAGVTTLDFSLSLAGVNEEVTVTATGVEESVFETFQSVNSVGTTRLLERASTSIGEVLEREAGVSKRSFGPGSSRPSIRGFEGDRVVVLQNGVRTGSLGSQSGDHGEPIDVLGLERVEVIKGPATLLYGSSAIGGVVNAVSGDEDNAHPGVRANFTALGGTVNRQGGIAGGIEYGFKKLVFKINGNFVSEGDYDTPLGRIPNSASRSYGGTAGIGYYGEKAFIAGIFGVDRRRYGVPYAPLFESGVLLSGDGCEVEKEAGKGDDCHFDIFAIRDAFANQLPPTPEEEIDIRMRRNNYRIRGGFRNVNGPIASGNFFVDLSDYQHEEVESEPGEAEAVATTFYNDVLSFRGMMQQAKYGKLSGRFGFEGFHRSYLTSGAEQLVAGRVRQNNFAVFGLEEFDFDRVSLQFGARVENNRYRPVNPEYLPRDFTGVSGAAGVRIRLWEGASFVTNFTSSYRPPSLEELYNEGPHIGTVMFEIGNQDLTRERSNGIEFSFRQNWKRVRINGGVFHYAISDFIYLAPQDADGDGNIDVEDLLPVGAYVQNDARFTGADLTADVDINKYVGVYFVGDVVKARLREGDLPLPRIAPARARIGMDLKYEGLSVRPEAVFVRQKALNDVFPLETPTAGYALFNVSGSYTYGRVHDAHIFTFSGQNLTNNLYRNHLSFIKDLMPEPGRGFKFSYTIRFF